MTTVHLLLISMLGCTDGGPEETVQQPEADEGVVSVALLSSSWPVRMADASVRSRFEGHAGWSQYFTRQHPVALSAFGAGEDPIALARMHVEHAAFYRQAALLHVNSSVNVYGELREDTDPAEVEYLLGIAKIFRGEEGAGEHFVATAALPSSPEGNAQWLAWHQAGMAWPPDEHLSGGSFPSAPGDVVPGTDPGMGSLPHYTFTEQTEEARTVEMGEPTSLYLLSRWHEAAARQVAPDQSDVIDQMLALWTLPAEPGQGAYEVQELDDGWLFAGFILSSADAAFLSDAKAKGLPSVEQWSSQSILASAISETIVDGAVVPDRALDVAAELEQQVRRTMEEAAGQEEGFHRAFADLAGLAALRGAMVVADANNQYRDAGILRKNILDQSIGKPHAADPVFMLASAAWDAQNSNPPPAQEMVHGLLGQFPSLAAARYPLDALHLRKMRSSVGGDPVH